MNNNIILIGFMGTGKTTVGKALAVKLDYPHLDLDDAIVKETNRDIPAIFQQDGEAAFRDIESHVLSKVLSRTGRVITTGGGAVLRQGNVDTMLANGIVVALRAKPETIIRRVSADPDRPLLAGDVGERVHRLMKEREGKYDFAPIQIDTDERQINEIVEEIIAQLDK